MGLTRKCILTDTIKAGAALAANLFVERDGTLPANGGNAWGVTAAAAKDDEYVPVDILGISIATADAAIAAGAALEVRTTGKVRPRTGSNTIVARARTAAAARDDLLEVVLIPN